MQTKVFEVKRAASNTILLASLAVASVLTIPAAQAQYMVVDGATITTNNNSQIVCCQSLYVQDYANFDGVNGSASDSNGMTSTAILKGMFDGYIGVIGAFIGIPAIITAVLRLFVSRQQTPRNAKKKSLELLAPSESSRYLKPSPVRF